VEFQVLGSVAAYHDGVELNLGRRQERCLLGLLLLEAGRVVSADSLLDRLWQGAPPASGRRTVHTYVARLRGRLAQVDVRIATRGAGYVIEIDPEQVDVHRFMAEVTRARAIADPAARAEALAAALRLWRGPLLAGVADDELRHQLGAGLEEIRLSATEACFEAQLQAGEHLDVVGPLTEHVAQYPTRERPAGLLMLALHRSGRSADAVEVYRQFRGTLVSELGLDPGPELQQLHRQILGNDSALAAPARATTPSRRRFLPRDIPDFTGRAAGLATLDRFAEDQTTVVISAIAGLGGVGKTALAIRWARTVAPRFPDGQFYLNLRGYDPGVPMRPVDALGRLLRWLDVPSERIPHDVEDAAALYRSLLADQKVLVLLDNARSAEQVRPLLPGNPDCLVVVTSRDGLGGLIARDGARRLVVEAMTAAEAVDLLARIVGAERVAAEKDAAADLASVCGYLPLALRIAATHLVDRPNARIGDDVAALRGGDRLAALAIPGDPDTGMRAVFDQSYHWLSEPERRVFRLLGLVPGNDVTVDAVAALASVDAASVLDRLVHANLVQAAAGRYSMHDLVKEFALSLGRDDREADAAVGRLLSYYFGLATDAVTVAAPQTVRLPASASEDTRRFVDPAEALSWLEAEQTNLVAFAVHASRHGPLRMAWRLADVLRGYFWICRDFDAWTTTAQAGLVAADAEDDRAGQAAMHLSLGIAYRSTSQMEPAIEHLRAALAMAREVSWPEGEASAIGSLGVASAEVGRIRDAVEYFGQALAVNRSLGRDSSVAVNLGNIGNLRALCGEPRQAIEDFRAAMVLYRSTANRAGEALMLSNLGMALHELGRLDEALAHLEQGLALHREVGDRYGESIATVALGELHLRLGRVESAAELGEAGERLADQTTHPTAQSGALNLLGAVCQQRGDPVAARTSYTHALAIARRIGYRVGQADVLDGLARLELSRCHYDEAAALAEEALSIAEADGYATMLARALTTIAEIRLAQRRPAEAVVAADRVLSICAESGYAHVSARAQAVRGSAGDCAW
jgi:DNA-binding SARP family transcriptional activator/tetratricopeptide (TPR) repeat protein